MIERKLERMIPDTRYDASSYPGDERPALGTTVKTILAAWNRAARPNPTGTHRVRAMVFLGQESWELCWKQDVIHRISSCRECRPVTASELELLTRAISYGWFLVYSLEAEGQEATVLHQVGILVPAYALSPGDLQCMLEERGRPAQHEQDAPSGERQPTALAVLEGEDLSTPRASAPDRVMARKSTEDGKRKRANVKEPTIHLPLCLLFGRATRLILLLAMLAGILIARRLTRQRNQAQSTQLHIERTNRYGV